MNIETIEQQIKNAARTIGFSHVGICAVEAAETPRFLSEWLTRNYHGQMRYMEDTRRSSPATVLAGVNTMIVVGLN
ncbi:MAG TPA: tRNA epoxyqueuosine(34) reductase QueG, partial [Acidobacteriota bacterium]